MSEEAGMIPQDAVTALAKHNFEVSYHEIPWAELADDIKAGWLEEALAQCEAAAPWLRAQALEDAADEMARLREVGRKPFADCTEDELADYYPYVQSRPERWLKARAVTERGQGND